MEINPRVRHTVRNLSQAPVRLPGCGAYDKETKKHQFPAFLLGTSLDEGKIKDAKASSEVLPGDHAEALMKLPTVQALVGARVIEVATGNRITVG